MERPRIAGVESMGSVNSHARERERERLPEEANRHENAVRPRQGHGRATHANRRQIFFCFSRSEVRGGVQAHLRHLRQGLQAQAPPEAPPQLRVRDRSEVQVRLLPAQDQVQGQPDEAHTGAASAPIGAELAIRRSSAGLRGARRRPSAHARDRVQRFVSRFRAKSLPRSRHVNRDQATSRTIFPPNR